MNLNKYIFREYDAAKGKLFEADKSVKTAVVMVQKDCSKTEALERLEKAGGLLRKVIE